MTTPLDQTGHTYVIFRIGAEEYGLAIDTVQSIVRYEEPTFVPRAPDVVLGVINLRGRVIPVIDLSRRMADTAFEAGPAARIVVVEGEAGTMGLAVDAAHEVVSLPEESIKPAPDSVLTPETAEMIEGVAEREGSLVILLDLDNAVPRTDYARLTDETDSEGGPDV